MIAIDRISYGYGSPPLIFKHFSWRVEAGETWAVLGPSGCGKTTLLYLLAGLVFPFSGHIRIDGQPLTRPRPHTGLIIQDYGLLPWATVRENVQFGLKIRNYYGPDGVHAPRNYQPTLDVESWMQRLGIMDQADQFPAQISGGEGQRAAIARTLALEPDLLLMDEPFSSLDAPTRESLQDLTLEIQREQNLTLVVVTHTIQEAALLGNRILILAPPPNIRARIIDNPEGGRAGFRDSPTFFELCRELRACLERGHDHETP